MRQMYLRMPGQPYRQKTVTPENHHGCKGQDERKRAGLVSQGKEYTDNKSLVRDYITEEELWACTTCNACAKECPININHPTLIVDMRRYLVMEEGSAPGEIKAVFSTIENNGAPWQYSPEDRMLWAKDLEMKVHLS